MPRNILDEAQIHPAIRERVAGHHAALVHEVQAAIAPARGGGGRHGAEPVSAQGARKALDAAGVPYHYLDYGSYFSEWRRRNALKMWTGWPTLPMVFVKGVLVGGADDLARLIDSGELQRLLA